MSLLERRIALMWRGDPRAPEAPTRYAERLSPVFDALKAQGFAPEPAVYFDERVEQIRAQLAGCAGVLVWINPLADGADRRIVDRMLRDVAAGGVWVGAHPDVIDKIGVKRVLYDTRGLSWGSDVDLYEALADFDDRFWVRLQRGSRVLKPNRGNDGQGVLKIKQAGIGGACDVQRASDDVRSQLTLDELRATLRPSFDAGIPIVDQEFHPATRNGLVRCYMSGARVIGFALQSPRAAKPDDAFGMRSDKEMHRADFAPLADLREMMERDWTPAMQAVLSITDSHLPPLWDADFLHRARVGQGCSRFALCEINASCVSPFPDTAPHAIAEYASRSMASFQS